MRSDLRPSAALIVAAGQGTRMGGPLAKQYLKLLGRSLLTHSIAAFADHAEIDQIQTVIHESDRALYQEAVAEFAILPPVQGGQTRQQSVRNGLEALAARGVKTVLIHDAARPFLDPTLIGAIMDALKSHDGAIAALPMTDTVKRARDGVIAQTVDRHGLWRALTPQGFHLDAILAAHRRFEHEAFTDDAALGERAGLNIALVQAGPENFKITTQQDFAMAERIAQAALSDVRTGSGFDVHRFGPGDHLWLCGIAVPHTHGLIGHSDADAGLHALTDAILGAIGAGDIGMHFPPTEERWRGARSDQFLTHAAGLVRAKGGMIAHVDVTLICERPRIGLHRDAMRARVAEILKMETARVSIKATTTEELGFTGRREGLAALATATVRLPF